MFAARPHACCNAVSFRMELITIPKKKFMNEDGTPCDPNRRHVVKYALIQVSGADVDEVRQELRDSLESVDIKLLRRPSDVSKYAEVLEFFDIESAPPRFFKDKETQTCKELICPKPTIELDMPIVEREIICIIDSSTQTKPDVCTVESQTCGELICPKSVSDRSTQVVKLDMPTVKRQAGSTTDSSTQVEPTPAVSSMETQTEYSGAIVLCEPPTEQNDLPMETRFDVSLRTPKLEPIDEEERSPTEPLTDPLNKIKREPDTSDKTVDENAEESKDEPSKENEERDGDVREEESIDREDYSTPTVTPKITGADSSDATGEKTMETGEDSIQPAGKSRRLVPPADGPTVTKAVKREIKREEFDSSDKSVDEKSGEPRDDHPEGNEERSGDVREGVEEEEAIDREDYSTPMADVDAGGDSVARDDSAVENALNGEIKSPEDPSKGNGEKSGDVREDEEEESIDTRNDVTPRRNKRGADLSSGTGEPNGDEEVDGNGDTTDRGDVTDRDCAVPKRDRRAISSKKKFSKRTTCNFPSCTTSLAPDTSAANLKQHAMIHSMEKRYKCPHCALTKTKGADVLKHIEKQHDDCLDTTIDRKNALLDAHWEHVKEQCFPTTGDEEIPEKRMKIGMDNKAQCRVCSVEVEVDDGSLFAHIVSAHSEENLDYDDPDGVKKRFFPDNE